MRRLLIAGNWKMNMGPSEGGALASGIANWVDNHLDNDQVEVLMCPPFVTIAAVREATGNAKIAIGAQDVHFEDEGAFTGAISTGMVKETGSKYIIVGHSERRAMFGDTDETVNKKVLKTLQDDLRPVICVGESLEQRKAKKHEMVVKDQVAAAVEGVTSEQLSELVIAYEPIWAIGTGETATPEQAQEMHRHIRQILADRYDADQANKVRILYGGSMKPHNAEELLSNPDVDGGLIGGASLKVDSFTKIIQIADQLRS
jgi:triosephosphate isomerase